HQAERIKKVVYASSPAQDRMLSDQRRRHYEPKTHLPAVRDYRPGRSVLFLDFLPHDQRHRYQTVFQATIRHSNLDLLRSRSSPFQRCLCALPQSRGATLYDAEDVDLYRGAPGRRTIVRVAFILVPARALSRRTSMMFRIAKSFEQH